MTSFLTWLKSLRSATPMTAAEIRRQFEALRRRHDQTLAQRDALALDAVDNESAAERWQRLNDATVEMMQKMQVLTAALPRAEAREAEAQRQAEAAERERRFQEYVRETAEIHKATDIVIARLVNGAELTWARDRRDSLREQARWLSASSKDAAVRRPFDPLEAIHDALAMRVQRIERARWIPRTSPITLLDDDRAVS